MTDNGETLMTELERALAAMLEAEGPGAVNALLLSLGAAELYEPLRSLPTSTGKRQALGNDGLGDIARRVATLVNGGTK